MEKKTINKGNNGNKNLSLYPLRFEEAVKDLLCTKPEDKKTVITSKDNLDTVIVKGHQQ